MTQYAKEVFVEAYIQDLKEEIYKIIDKSPENWEIREVMWTIKNIMTGKGWFPITQRKTKEYKKYKEELRRM